MDSLSPTSSWKQVQAQRVNTDSLLESLQTKTVSLQRFLPHLKRGGITGPELVKHWLQAALSSRPGFEEQREQSQSPEEQVETVSYLPHVSEGKMTRISANSFFFGEREGQAEIISLGEEGAEKPLRGLKDPHKLVRPTELKEHESSTSLLCT